MPSEEFTFTTSAWSRRDRWMDWLLLVWFYCLMDGKRRFKSEQVLLMEGGREEKEGRNGERLARCILWWQGFENVKWGDGKHYRFSITPLVILWQFTGVWWEWHQIESVQKYPSYSRNLQTCFTSLMMARGGQGREGGTALEWLALHRIAPIARFCALSVPAHVFESSTIHPSV